MESNINFERIASDKDGIDNIGSNLRGCLGGYDLFILHQHLRRETQSEFSRFEILPDFEVWTSAIERHQQTVGVENNVTHTSI